LAIGTSTPELVIGLVSVFKGYDELLIGNVIGADILNVLFVIFKAAKSGRFSRWMGVPMLVIYILYTVVQYAVS